MFVGSLPPVSNRADWIETIEILDNDSGEPVDLTGCTIEVEIRKQSDGCEVLSASTADAKVIIPATGIFQFGFTLDEMSALLPGTYDAGARITRDGNTVQILIGQVPVLEGVVQ